jgi:type I restriction enzyme S subunit
LTTEKTISDKAIREARLQVVRTGSLLFSFKLSVGLVSIAGVDMYTNEAIATFVPSARVDTQYMYWAAPVLVPRNAQENIYGAPLLNRERIANAQLLSLPVPEQRAIAAFLDRETARIDALVAKNERLIELLEEERSVLITRTVTKGLDPNVPMKDSCVEWLGDIPAHWAVKRLKHISSIDNSGAYGAEAGESAVDLPLCTTAHITPDGLFLVEDMPLRSFSIGEEARYTGRPGDVFVVKSSGSNTNIISGKLALVTRDTPEIVFGNFLMRIRPLPRSIAPQFLAYLLRSDLTRERIERMVATTTYPNIDVPEYVGSALAIPPLEEQKTIASFLDGETARIDALVAKVHDAIERLTELRTSFISAAVTGKIDVRDEVA